METAERSGAPPLAQSAPQTPGRMTSGIQYRPGVVGFRFNLTDAAMLAAGLAGTVALWPWTDSHALFLAIVVGHFFLFCNVFRLRRAYELAWAVLFVANVAFWVGQGQLSWGRVLATQAPISVLLILFEVCSPRYHGVLCQHVNPRLDEFLA